MAATVAVGDIVAGKYRVERTLGQGGMGVVVAAVHVQLEQPVALKFLLAEGLANEEVVGRFLREAKSAVRLRSEHVARVLDVGQTDEGAPYIVMEYLDGRDLSEVLDDTGTLSVSTAVGYVLQACEAVAEAHVAGIVHRDLKPANLFLIRRNDGSPCIKVLDFGISKALGPSTDNLTKTTGLLGTPSYMSPEQMRSSKNVDTRSDIWALGMILYELVTGQVAFTQQSLPELCAAVLTDPTPSPRELAPDLPLALEEAILRALAKDPEQRFQTLAAFSAAIAPFAPGGEAARDRVSRILGVPAVAHADITLPDVPRPPLAASMGHPHSPHSVVDVQPAAASGAGPAERNAGELQPSVRLAAMARDAEEPLQDPAGSSSPLFKVVAVVAVAAVVVALGLAGSALRADPDPGAATAVGAGATATASGGSGQAMGTVVDAAGADGPSPLTASSPPPPPPPPVTSATAGSASTPRVTPKSAPPKRPDADFGGRK